MIEKNKLKFTCGFCEVNGTIIVSDFFHGVEYCPFCAGPIEEDEEDENDD